MNWAIPLACGIARTGVAWMSSSYAVERLDVKSAQFCPACGKVVFGRQFWQLSS